LVVEDEADIHLVGSGLDGGMPGVPDIDTKGEAEGSRNKAHEHQPGCVAKVPAHIHEAVDNDAYMAMDDRDTAEERAEQLAMDQDFRQGAHE
jgi:hypothetical protein